MTDHLGITQIASSQSNRSVTQNDANTELSEAMADFTQILVDNTNARTITGTEWTRGMQLSLEDDAPAPTAAVTVTVPTTTARGIIVIWNQLSFPATITVSGQTETAPVIEPGAVGVLTSNGTDIISASKSTASADAAGNYAAVRVATVANGALATAFENGDTVDGITLATGDRILLKDQSTGAENGIYTVEVSGAPTRATDMDTSEEVRRGALIPVIEGDENAKKTFMHTTSGAITLDTTALTFELTGIQLSTIHLCLGSLREIISNDIPITAEASGDAGVLSSDTTPTYSRVNGATDKALRVEWASSNSDEVQFPPVIMPPDLDETVDLTIHLLFEMSGATDTPTVDVQVFDGVGDTEMGSATSALTNSITEEIITIANADISGNPTGFLNISLVPGAHTTDTIRLYGAWIEYARKPA